MPLKRGSSRAVIAHNIKAERRAGKPKRQAIAIALAKARQSRGLKTSRKWLSWAKP